MAENLPPITKKVENNDQPINKIRDILKESNYQNETTQLAIEKTKHQPAIPNQTHSVVPYDTS